MVDKRETLKQSYSFYAEEYAVSLSELEAFLGLNTQFRARLELAVCLKETFSQKNLLKDSLQPKIDEYRHGIECVLDENRGLVPDRLRFNGRNAVRGQITEFPIAACLLQQVELEHQKALSFVNLLLFFALILNPEKNYKSTADDIRHFCAQPRLPSSIMGVLNQIREKDNYDEMILVGKTAEQATTEDVNASLLKAVLRLALDVKNSLASVEVEHDENNLPSKLVIELEPENEVTAHPEDEVQTLDMLSKNDVLLSRRWIANLLRLVPNDYRRFLHPEKEHFVNFLTAAISSKNKLRRDSAGLIFLSYITGRNTTDVGKLTVGKDCDLDPAGYYRRKILLPPTAFNADENVKGQRERIEFIRLKIPKIIVDWLKLLPKKNDKLSECIGASQEELNIAITSLFEEIRTPVQFNRIRADKVPAALSLELTLLYRDESLTHILSGKINHAHPTLTFYNAHEAKFVERAYSDALCELLSVNKSTSLFESNIDYADFDDSDAVVGYYPTNETIISLRKNAENALEQAKRSGSVFEVHNAYVDYCLLLLYFGTGHRPVEDPFAKFSHFDLKRKLVAISDKVVTVGREWRVVAMPTMAVKQVEYYCQYLYALASKLQHEPGFEELANSLVDQLQNQSVNLPFFFYLREDSKSNIQSVDQSTMKTRWAKFWDWPENFPRHIVASELSRRTKCGELVKIQIGHNFASFDHFGKCSTLSPLNIFSRISKILDASLESFGWCAIKSPFRKTTQLTSVKTRGKKIKPLLGVEKRAKKRNANLKKASEVIRTLVKNMFNKYQFSQLTDDELEELSATIECDNEQESVVQLKCLRLLNRYGRLLRKGTKRKSTRLGMPLSFERSPFDENTLENYSRAFKIREKFLRYLNEQENKKAFNSCERFAEITISAALMGGLLNIALLNDLPKELATNLTKVDNDIFVNFSKHNNSNNIIRWYPDSVTSGLILGLVKQTRGKFNAPRTLAYERVLEKLLRTLNILTSNTKYSNLESLINVATNLSILELPGFIRAYATGAITAASLPSETLARIAANQAISVDASESETKSSNTKLYAVPSLIQQDSPRLGIIEFKNIFKNFNAEADNLSFSGAEERKRKCKARLLTLLTDSFSQPENIWGLTSKLVGGFCICLIKEGTPYKSSLAYNTVTDYTWHVIRFIQKYASELDISLTDLYELDFEPIYIDALESSPQKDVTKAANILHQFHLFLVEKHGFDDIDWSQMYAIAGKKFIGAHIDANYLSETEYIDVLNALLKSDQIDPWKRDQLALILMFTYRGRLRIAEALGLLMRDVILSDVISIIAKQNIIRGLKSKASKRYTVFDEPISKQEDDVITRYIDNATIDIKSDKLSPFFNNKTGQKREVISRSYASQTIHKFLRVVTGDPTMRIHHGRHTGVTKKAEIRLNPKPQDANRKQEIQEFFPLKEISVELGHASELTTLSSYCHCLDKLLVQWLPANEDLLTDKGRAYALAIPYVLVRKKRTKTLSASLLAPSSNAVAMKFISKPDVTLIPRSHGNLEKCIQPNKHKISIVDIENILRRLVFTTKKPKDFAASLNISESVIEQVIYIAADIERSSGYQRYRLNERLFAIASKQNAPSISTISFSDKEIDRLKRYIKDAFLKLSNGRIDSLSTMHALATWCKTYHYKNGSNLVQNPYQFSQLMALVDTLLDKPLIALNFESKEKEVESGILIPPLASVHYMPLPKTHEKINLFKQNLVEFRIKTAFERKVAMMLFYIMQVYFCYENAYLEETVNL